MLLRKWLNLSGLTQREVAKKLGYTGNGFIALVNTGRRSIPSDDIPKWADALKLDGENRRKFIAEASEAAIPDWMLRNVKELRARIDQADNTIKSLSAFLTPTSADAELEQAFHDMSQSKLLDLVLLLARANRGLAMLARDPKAVRSSSLKDVLAALVQARDHCLIPCLEALEAVAPTSSDTPAT